MARKPVKSRKTQKTTSPKKTYFVIGLVTLVAVLGLGALLALSLQPDPGIAGVINYPSPSRGHDNTLDIAFSELPPAGGIHNDVWQNCGIYEEPVKAQHAVHSLEHGAVWITYQPDLPEAAVAQLQDLVQGQTYVLLSPYPEQRSPIVLSAWGVQLEVETPQDERIAQFVERYRLGPQTPERGAACTGGTGEPAA